jgi:hypothetical protein
MEVDPANRAISGPSHREPHAPADTLQAVTHDEGERVESVSMATELTYAANHQVAVQLLDGIERSRDAFTAGTLR